MRLPWNRSLTVLGSALTMAFVLATALIGAQVGAVLAGSRSVMATATVTLALQPDAVVSGDPNRTMDTTPTDDGSFLQRELVYLGGPELEREVRAKTTVDAALEATQVEKSTVVALAATAESPEQAQRADAAAVAIYADRRRRIANERLTTLARETELQTDAVRKSLQSVSGNAGSRSGGGDSPQTSALQSRYANLLALAGSIQFVRQTVGDGVAVIQAPTVPARSGAPSKALGAALGGLLGLVVGLSTLILRRRFDPRISSAAEIEDTGARVITPVTPRIKSNWGTQLVSAGARASSRLTRSISLQSAQLLPERDHHQTRGLILVGVSTGMGTSILAAQHAAILARRRPTLLVCAADLAGADLASLLGSSDDQAGLAELAMVDGPVQPDDVRAKAAPSRVPGLSLLGAGIGGNLQGLELLAERGLVRAAREAGWDVVVDAPALGISPVATAFARDADAVALGVGLGLSRPEDVEGALRVLDAAGVVSSGVLLYHPITGRASRRGSRKVKSGPHHGGTKFSQSVQLGVPATRSARAPSVVDAASPKNARLSP